MRRIIFILSLLTLCSNVFGNTENSSTVQDTIKSGFSYRFIDNWSIGATVGANVYFGEEDSKGNFLKRISPSFEIQVTKTATPVISFRGLASVGVVNGWYRSTTPLNPYDGELHHESFNLMTAQLHVLFNISNAIGGYKEKRRYNIIPFLGTGAAIPWGGGRTNRELIFLAGILNTIYLAPKLDFTVELRHMFVNPRMNYIVKSGRLYEGMGTISVGLSYKFGKKRIKLSNAIPEQNSHRVTDQTLFIESHQRIENKNATDTAVAPAISGVKEPVVVRDTVYLTPPLLIFFPINESYLTDNECVRLDQYMHYVLKRHPNKEFKLFNLSGHADKDTGNTKINQRLSEQRVETIRRILVEKYKIPLGQISLKAEGDTNNQFEKASSNRVVILQ